MNIIKKILLMPFYFVHWILTLFYSKEDFEFICNFNKQRELNNSYKQEEKIEEFIPLSKKELDSLVLVNLPNYKANCSARKIKINKTILKDLDDFIVTEEFPSVEKIIKIKEEINKKYKPKKINIKELL